MKKLVIAAVAAAVLASGWAAETVARGGGNWGGGSGAHNGQWHGGSWQGGHPGRGYSSVGYWQAGRWNHGYYGSRHYYGWPAAVALGLAIGLPAAYYWGPGYYYSDYPGPVYVERAPVYVERAPVYVEREPVYVDGRVQKVPERASTQRQQYSLYCPDPAGYYPAVPKCEKGWLRVIPDGAPSPTPLPQ